MSTAFTTFVLGYHGCDRKLAARIFAGKASLRPSENDYDWLGDWIYFWEHSAARALDYARELSAQPRHRGQKIKTPAVVGAIIDLGACLNLLDSRYIELVQDAYADLVTTAESTGLKLPRNTVGKDRLVRKLDCAVIRLLHTSRATKNEPPFDTVRAMFAEGEPLYPHAGFSAKNHIQICVRNPLCIKGYFRPPAGS